jgi:PBP1b-binding outer membrane lipoprotein LpoB
MKTKIIVLLLIFGAVLFSGCTGNEHPSTEKNATPEETATPVENTTIVDTPEENATAIETETSEENVTQENVTQENVTQENVTQEKSVTSEGNGRLNVSTTEIKQTPYLLRLINKRASSSSLDIKKGESVSWVNMEDSPKRILTLVSEEKLFDDTRLSYKRAFTYTFNETGDYHFSVVGQPRMNVTVSVAEP